MSILPIFPMTGATAYRLDNAVSDGVTFDPQDGTSLSSSGADSLTWKPDGSRFFVADGGGGASSGNIYYYDCATANDINTASYAGDLNISGTLDMNCTAFNASGSRIVAQIDNSVQTYSLSTAYGGSATLVESDGFGRESDGGFFFNGDGSAVYYRNNQGQNLYTRALSTAYLVSSKGAETAITTAFPAGDMTVARGGTRVLIAGSGEVKEYGGDAYDFANFTLRETYAVTNVNFARYSENGRKLHTCISGSSITQHSTGG